MEEAFGLSLFKEGVGNSDEAGIHDVREGGAGTDLRNDGPDIKDDQASSAVNESSKDYLSSLGEKEEVINKILSAKLEHLGATDLYSKKDLGRESIESLRVIYDGLGEMGFRFEPEPQSQNKQEAPQEEPQTQTQPLLDSQSRIQSGQKDKGNAAKNTRTKDEGRIEIAAIVESFLPGNVYYVGPDITRKIKSNPQLQLDAESINDYLKHIENFRDDEEKKYLIVVFPYFKSDVLLTSQDKKVRLAMQDVVKQDLNQEYLKTLMVKKEGRGYSAVYFDPFNGGKECKLKNDGDIQKDLIKQVLDEKLIAKEGSFATNRPFLKCQDGPSHDGNYYNSQYALFVATMFASDKARFDEKERLEFKINKRGPQDGNNSEIEPKINADWVRFDFDQDRYFDMGSNINALYRQFFNQLNRPSNNVDKAGFKALLQRGVDNLMQWHFEKPILTELKKAEKITVKLAEAELEKTEKEKHCEEQLSAVKLAEAALEKTEKEKHCEEQLSKIFTKIKEINGGKYEGFWIGNMPEAVAKYYQSWKIIDEGKASEAARTVAKYGASGGEGSVLGNGNSRGRALNVNGSSKNRKVSPSDRGNNQLRPRIKPDSATDGYKSSKTEDFDDFFRGYKERKSKMETAEDKAFRKIYKAPEDQVGEIIMRMGYEQSIEKYLAWKEDKDRVFQHILKYSPHNLDEMNRIELSVEDKVSYNIWSAEIRNAAKSKQATSSSNPTTQSKKDDLILRILNAKLCDDELGDTVTSDIFSKTELDGMSIEELGKKLEFLKGAGFTITTDSQCNSKSEDKSGSQKDSQSQFRPEAQPKPSLDSQSQNQSGAKRIKSCQTY